MAAAVEVVDAAVGSVDAGMGSCNVLHGFERTFAAEAAGNWKISGSLRAILESKVVLEYRRGGLAQGVGVEGGIYHHSLPF